MSPLTLLLALMAVASLILTIMHASGAKVPLWVPVFLLALLSFFEVFLPAIVRRP